MLAWKYADESDGVQSRAINLYGCGRDGRLISPRRNECIKRSDRPNYKK